MQQFSILVALLMVAFGASAQGRIYKWVDEDGVVQYTQQPPVNAQAKEIKPPPPPGEAPEAARQRLQQQIEAFDERRAARVQGAEEAARSRAEKEEIDAFCAKARENLQIATSNNRVLERGQDGNLVPLSPEQLADKVKLLQAQVAEYCG